MKVADVVRAPLRLVRRLFGRREPAARRALRRVHRERGRLFFVQIGAHDGVSFDDLHGFMTALPGAAGLVVEPLPDAFERLAANYRDFPEIRPVCTALHPTRTRVTLHRVAPERLASLPAWAAGIGSLDPTHHRRSGTPADAMIREDVDACTLTQLLEREGVTHIDYLQIDTEGFDWHVLRMLDLSRFRPAVIKYESVNLGEADRRAADAHLRAHGYETRDDGPNDRVAILRASTSDRADRVSAAARRARSSSRP